MLLKDGGDTLTAALHILLQLTWRNERVPTDWQMGAIVPLHKAGDRTDPGNYRGITLQPVVLKVLCQILLTRLQAILDPADPTKPGFSQLADEGQRSASFLLTVKWSVTRPRPTSTTFEAAIGKQCVPTTVC